MELLIMVGTYALWFLINSLAAMYMAMIGGIGLAAGFHIFKSSTSTKRKKNNIKLAEEALSEVDKQAASTAVL